MSGLPIWPQMLAYALSSNTWWAVAFLAAVSVLSILGLMAKILRYELLLIQVVASARKMRNKLEKSIDEADLAIDPQSEAASQALKNAKTASMEDQSVDAQQLTADSDQVQENDEANNVDETEAIEAQENSAAAA